MIRFLLVLCVILPIGASAQESLRLPQGKFLVLNSVSPAIEAMPAHILHLTFKDGWIRFSLARADQPDKRRCDAGGPCWWDIQPLSIHVEQESDGRLLVGEVHHQRGRIVISRDRDLPEVVVPIVALFDGATVATTDDGLALTNGHMSVGLLNMDYNDAKRALLLSQLADPDDKRIIGCFAKQLAAIGLAQNLTDAEREMLEIARLAGTMGDLSAAPTFWREGLPEDEREARTVLTRTQLMGVLGGMIFAPAQGGETIEALLGRVIEDDVIASTLDAEGLQLSLSLVKRNGEAILGMRRYAAWLRRLPASEIRPRLCRSILPD